LDYHGIAARLSLGGGIRSQYVVNTEALKALEDAGCKVVYGAIMGVHKNGATTYASDYGALDITTESSFSAGYTLNGTNKALTVVYATGGGNDKVKPVNQYNDENLIVDGVPSKMFSYTLTMEKGTARTEQNYQVELLFRGFCVVIDGNTETIVYDNAEGSVFGTQTAQYGLGTSVAEASHYFKNCYTDETGRHPFFGNYWLNFVLEQTAYVYPQNKDD
ncbi:MAG: hypothetical protein MJ078_08610, partial [Clostridia bacterium]|nr:hypothetical protein [Clostridia bacterium]